MISSQEIVKLCSSFDPTCPTINIQNETTETELRKLKNEVVLLNKEINELNRKHFKLKIYYEYLIEKNFDRVFLLKRLLGLMFTRKKKTAEYKQEYINYFKEFTSTQADAW